MASAELQIPEHIQETQNITREELEMILHTQNPLVTEELRRRAQQTAKAIYGNKIYVRGLIEFTNYCKNNCYYCGIRCSNTDADRYRLSLEQILSCCETGWNLGFRTFVLQGGEDPHFTDEHICQIVRTIKEIYPDCAVTLSIGEKSEEAIRHILMQALTDISCVMRQQMKIITENFTRNRCPWFSEKIV